VKIRNEKPGFIHRVIALSRYLFFFSIFYPLSVLGAPVFVETHVPDVDSGAGPFTNSIEVTCGDDQYMFVALRHDTPIEATSVVYDGDSASLLLHDEQSGGFTVELWGLVNPTCGTPADLVVTNPSSGDTSTYVAVYDDVLQVDPIDDTDVQYRSTGSADVVTSIATTEDDEIIFMFVQGTGTITDDNATTRYEDTRPANNRFELNELDAPTTGNYSTTYNDALHFEMTALSVSVLGVVDSPPATPAATTTVATTTLEFVSQEVFRSVIVFFISVVFALWISRLILL